MYSITSEILLIATFLICIVLLLYSRFPFLSMWNIILDYIYLFWVLLSLLSFFIWENLMYYFFIFWLQALFWQQQNYYGVDLTPLYRSAFQGYFSQVNYSYIFLKYIEVLFPVLLAFNKLSISKHMEVRSEWSCVLLHYGCVGGRVCV